MVETLPALRIDLNAIGARAAAFARLSRSAATERAYGSDWVDFVAWCKSAERPSLPADPITVGAYLSDRSGILKPSTLARRIAAITAAHRLGGHGFDSSHPAVANVMAGIRRTYGTRQDAKTALLTEDLRRVVKSLPATLGGIRDRAVLLVGFAGAFRRSELVALNLEDVQISNAGITVTVRRSKTDQLGAGRELGIPRSRKSATCPAAALEAWLQESRKFLNPGEIGNSPVFRAIDHGKPAGRLGGQAIAKIVKKAAQRVGLDPKRFAGHSLRSGFATSAARGGADLAFIMLQTGHKNADVARRYVHAGKLLDNPASKAVSNGRKTRRRAAAGAAGRAAKPRVASSRKRGWIAPTGRRRALRRPPENRGRRRA
jgi:integrase